MTRELLFSMVHETGLEPARSCDQRILSPLRLPVPPLVPTKLPLRIELKLSDYKSLRLPLADRSIMRFISLII